MKKAFIDKGIMTAVRNHLEKVVAISRNKLGVDTGKKETLFDAPSKKKGKPDLMSLIKNAGDKEVGPDIKKKMLALHVDERKLKELLNKEIKLAEQLHEDAKTTTEKGVLNEVQEEYDFASHLEHEMTLLIEIQKLSATALNRINKEVSDGDWKTKSANHLLTLNNRASELLEKITHEQSAHLKDAYNELHRLEIEKSRETLAQIAVKFERLQPKDLL